MYCPNMLQLVDGYYIVVGLEQISFCIKTLALV
jgi:hypothetical protein